MNDQRILALFRDRSQDAVAQARQKYGGKMFRLAWNILGSDRDAEECVNDALLAAWNAIPPQEPDPLLPWLYATTRNIAMNRARANAAQKRGARLLEQVEELDQVAADPETTESAVDQRELTRALERFLGRLSRRDQAIFMGRYYYGESYAQIASRLDMTEDNCKTRAYRLRERLKKTLKKEGAL